MSKVECIWVTPKAEDLLAYMAKVSNPTMQGEGDYAKLISYLMRNSHWSPFEMVHMCVEINTTRDIARQILRHRSFSFQEFSQRYADVTLLGGMETRECRLQDHKNRQSSLSTDDAELVGWWGEAQKAHIASTTELYIRHLQRVLPRSRHELSSQKGIRQAVCIWQEAFGLGYITHSYVMEMVPRKSTKRYLKVSLA